ncbi:MAG: hypothetical protein KR126chlam4_00587 [Candidatus Anoxychlamydiales bacterium]|nr:hypothetical protein [Candidatus Anoxychlamydiales bacterium]NGX40756.1 hypothetical protein [Candidatus Anoxychlamydiales bacterium]HEU64951.1 hypothetical protein [Chlamydiota bacterium]
MKRLMSILFVASFAAFPLFAAEEEVVVEEPAQEEVTIDEVKESQEVEAEVTIQEDQKDEEKAEEAVS